MLINTTRNLRSKLLGGATLTALVLSESAFAQEAPEEIIVTGTRQVIQDTIKLKRDNVQIVDGLFADEIGELPALSIGEALESITGVASHRENGGATEVSIRGLGPYLSSTTINGRLVGNGSGDRSVNFSQFPSELVNKLAVFKTQDASQIEGGVAGQIQIDTLKPLDYGKQRIQFDIKGNINPDQLNIRDNEAGDLGFRGTASYVDQFEVNGLGSIGISIGGQHSKISQPESEVRSTSNFGTSSFACLVNPVNPVEGQAVGIGFSNNPIESDRDCEDYRAPDASDGGANDSNNIGFDTSIDALTNGVTISDTEEVNNVDVTVTDSISFDVNDAFVLVPSQRHYRQNDTTDARDALFGQIQWQPNDRLDVNLDAQWSERTQSEQRNDLTFNGWKRNEQGLNGLPGYDVAPKSVDLLEYNSNGTITRAFTDNTIEVQGGDYERVETFEAIGLNGSYEVNERLSVSADLAYSKVERTEKAIEFRIQSDSTPTIEYVTDSGIAQYNLYDVNFDVNDHDNYVDRLRVRIDNDVYRENEFTSGRFDVDYDLDAGIFTSVQAGVRFAEQGFLSVPGGSDSYAEGRTSFEIENDGEFTFNNTEIVDDADSRSSTFDAFWDAQDDFFVDIIAETNEACRGAFPESNFLSSLRDGDLVNVIDDDGTVLSSTSSWGVFDATCVANTSIAAINNVLDEINAFGALVAVATDDGGSQIDGSSSSTIPQVDGLISTDIPGLDQATSRTIDVQEDTTAIYAMANYDATLGSYPVRGNVGLRVVNTEVTSTSYRQGYEITGDADSGFAINAVGDAVPVSESFDYTEFLPSATAIVDINDETLLRFGAFRAISRADPADMGYDRTLNTQDGSDDDPITDANDLISGVSASGNPSIDPLTSWNFDAGVEWYPNADSILAVSAYYKTFEGGFQNVTQNETYTIDGVSITIPVSGLQQVTDDESELYGVEITGTHAFSYLPGYLSGLGVKGSYNYVQSDFESEDILYGDQFERDLDGNITQTNVGIVDPAGLPGLSENVFSGTVYYQIGDLDTSIIYKYRDSYFQPSTTNGQAVRYIGDTGVWEARAAYKINDNFRVTLEAINIFDEPKRQYAWNDDNQYEVNSYGARVFFGLRGKF